MGVFSYDSAQLWFQLYVTSLKSFLLTADVFVGPSALLLNERMLSPGRDIKYQLHLAEFALELVFVYLPTAAEVFGSAAFLLFVHQSTDLISQLFLPHTLYWHLAELKSSPAVEWGLVNNLVRSHLTQITKN